MDTGLSGCRLDFMFGRGVELLVCIEAQHPVPCAFGQRAIACRGEVVVPGVVEHSGSQTPGSFDSIVFGTGIDHDDFVDHPLNRSKAVSEKLGLIPDDHRQADGGTGRACLGAFSLAVAFFLFHGCSSSRPTGARATVLSQPGRLYQTRLFDRPGDVAHAFSVLCRAFETDIFESIEARKIQ